MLNHKITERDDEMMAACKECGYVTRFSYRTTRDDLRVALTDHNREHAIPCADELAAALCRATGESDYAEMSEDAKEFFRQGARAVVKEFLAQTGEAFFRFNSLTTDVNRTDEGVSVRFACCDQSASFPAIEEARALETVAGHVCGGGQ